MFGSLRPEAKLPVSLLFARGSEISIRKMIVNEYEFNVSFFIKKTCCQSTINKINSVFDVIRNTFPRQHMPNIYRANFHV